MAETLVQQGPIGELINRLYDLYLDGKLKQLACITMSPDDDLDILSTMSYPELLGSMDLVHTRLEVDKTDLMFDPTDYDYSD